MSHEINVRMTTDNLKDLICKEVLSKEGGSFAEVAKLQDLLSIAESVFKAKDYLQEREVRLSERMTLVVWMRDNAAHQSERKNLGPEDFTNFRRFTAEMLQRLEDKPELEN